MQKNQHKRTENKIPEPVIADIFVDQIVPFYVRPDNKYSGQRENQKGYQGIFDFVNDFFLFRSFTLNKFVRKFFTQKNPNNQKHNPRK